jgi:isopentenyl diphosphate isomerase/L-lactate dehydrogenase-like FMN-dependent dehydrogenase
MCDSQAELAIGRAASAAGTIYVVPGFPFHPVEEIRKLTDGPAWFQLYTAPTREETKAIIDRVKGAGYDVLVVTVDTAVNPIRPRDYYNRLSIPLSFSPRMIRHGASRPLWAKDFLFGRVSAGGGKEQSTVVYMREFARMVSVVRSITLDELAWIKEVWGGPLVVKGIMRGEEVPSMIDVGVNGIVVSNHGGRNLDGARPTIDCLPDVVAAADGRIEVYMDGGIRRGSDVIRALALGARAVMVGRPYMFGLAAFGEAGVAQVLEIMRREFEYSAALAGCPTVADIDRSIVCS